MLRGSAKWPGGLGVLLVLELLLLTFSIDIGSAMPSRKELVPDTDSSIGGDQLSTSNYPHSRKVRSTKEDDLFSDLEFHTKTGIYLVQKIVTAVIGRFGTHFAFEAMKSTDETEMRKSTSLQAGFNFRDEVESATGNGRRLLRGPRFSKDNHVWSVKQQQHLYDQGRKLIEGSSSPPPAVGPQTQQFVFSPPAPPGMVHNEKQDWNQDYAEPDVHPPSSN